jgi:hypothetical protein
MYTNQFEIRVLVKGRSIQEFPHNGQVFIEGREGSNFEIEIKNHTNQRVEAVLSVDGLSILDGEEAGYGSRGFVLDPFQIARIPGWKLTDQAAAAFVFSGSKGSYVAQSTGSARNTGVIGVMAFKEKAQPAVFPHYPPVYPNTLLGGSPFRSYNNTSAPTLSSFGARSAGMSKGIAPRGGEAINHMSATLSASASSSDSVGYGATMDWMDQEQERSAGVTQSLGTGFGHETNFKTTEVSFIRGDMLVTMAMYYDNARGLRARGIELSKKAVRVNTQPEAFPAIRKGCKPPVGWKG